MKKRYCAPCDRFVPARERECKLCGADTDKVPEDQQGRERDEDDGRTYADPRDEMFDRLLRD